MLSWTNTQIAAGAARLNVYNRTPLLRAGSVEFERRKLSPGWGSWMKSAVPLDNRRRRIRFLPLKPLLQLLSPLAASSVWRVIVNSRTHTGRWGAVRTAPRAAAYEKSVRAGLSVCFQLQIMIWVSSAQLGAKSCFLFKSGKGMEGQSVSDTCWNCEDTDLCSSKIKHHLRTKCHGIFHRETLTRDNLPNCLPVKPVMSVCNRWISLSVSGIIHFHVVFQKRLSGFGHSVLTVRVLRMETGQGGRCTLDGCDPSQWIAGEH